ncbi:hypothetical protein GCM10009771_14770 [Nesterenkonia flava]
MTTKITVVALACSIPLSVGTPLEAGRLRQIHGTDRWAQEQCRSSYLDGPWFNPHAIVCAESQRSDTLFCAP